MSTTTSTADNPSLQANLLAFAHTPTSLCYVVTHVFLPVGLPDQSDYTLENDHSLARAVCAAAHAYAGIRGVCGTFEQAEWHRVTRMLDNLQASVQSEPMDHHHVIAQLRGMQTGDILSFFIRRQNVAIVLTKRENCTLCEAFDVFPGEDALRGAQTSETLICSHPGSAVETPNEVFDDGEFQFEFSHFLSRPNAVDSYPPLPPPADPQYITALLDGVLQSVGPSADTPRITKRTVPPSILGGDPAADILRVTKRVRDYAALGWTKSTGKDVWRRSPLWLFIRVAIQTSVHRSLGRASYKRFMLFLMCTLARDEGNTSLSSDLLHLMSSRILRRLGKLGSSTPDWLSEVALGACTCLHELLDVRWGQLNARPSPFRNPSQAELARDTQLSLLDSREYIRNALTSPGPQRLGTPFHPNHRRRGTIEDFLSSGGSFFDEAYDADPDITLYDVGRSVEDGLDDWLACVTDVDEACAQLEILMDRYMINLVWKLDSKLATTEDWATRLLTGIELYVALDKLVVKEIPMLADYPPEISVASLEGLFLRKTTNLHRLSCAYQYLSARHSQSRLRCSVLSDEFTEDSFPVRYYDQSPRLQQLKVRIEEDAVNRISGQASPQLEGSLSRTPRRRLAESPLPALPLHAKVVVFELRCPACIRIWRSAALRILLFSDRVGSMEEDHHLLARVPALQPYLVERQGPPLGFQIHFAYFYPGGFQSRNSPILRYVLQFPSGDSTTPGLLDSHLGVLWQPAGRGYSHEFLFNLKYRFGEHCPSCRDLEKYVNCTSHTPNDVLSAQADCLTDLSLDEFITFAHLRSGGSLQWLNILQGLRSRTLNLRRHQAHFLLTHAAFQVGPLDMNTGTWVWHQELQDSGFCNALLDELESLVVEAGARLVDGVLMSTVSLLLTRVLGSNPSEGVSERALSLLRSVRRKTFSWVQELSYGLAKVPTSKERRNLLLEMAATCRSTFDVDTDTLRKLFHSAEDIDALLSCAFFIQILCPESIHDRFHDRYLQLLLGRDNHLFLVVEEILADVILADASDYGVDLAVGRIFASHQPGTQRWERLQYPNARWLTCKTEATVNQPSQIVHINLFDGALRVNGQLLGGLPRDLREIFRDQGFLSVPSNLPGMDLMTLPMMSNYKVHFSLRDHNLVVRAQGNQSDEILELIPSRKLRGDLPPALVDGHVHWLNPSTKIIEIRPFGQLWEQSSEHWRIDCASGRYRVYNGRETLVDIRSPTWAMVFESFNCLNNVSGARWIHSCSHDGYFELQNQSMNLLITTIPIDSVQCTSAQQLSVALPVYGLSCFVNEREELESRDFKDMVYDENQSVGALFGLENLLVLWPKTQIAGNIVPDALIPRRVLIPNGFPKPHGNNQVRIRLDAPHLIQSDDPLYHTYDVDTELGCLIGNGSLMSTRFLAYLHAMTSCHRLDPLTCRTGTQAALCLLRSAGCRSIMKLKALDIPDPVRWSSTLYPSINAAYQEIRSRYYWNRHMHGHEVFTAAKKHCAQPATYLFPSNAAGQISLEDSDDSKCLTPREPGPPTLPHSILSVNQHLSRHISLDHLLCTRPAPELPVRSSLLRDNHNISSDGIPLLDQLFSSLRADSSFQREYLAHLDTSAQCVHVVPQIAHKVSGENPIETLKKHYVQCRINYLDSLDTLKKSLGPTTNPREQAVDRSSQWPPITADVLLRYLASTSTIDIPLHWKKCLTSLALLLLELQRARRLLRFALDGLEEEFSKELENEGCDGWNAEEYPDWLLIQIQGNFLIRRAQAETAMEIMSPRSSENTMMQVNMGEGKSSVIIPIAAAALANGKQLVRVVVPKALMVQMFELLVARLGGLTNRPIYHLPFSRAPEYDGSGSVVTPQIDDLHKLMSQCMTERGILLVQPEHVVSLKLMGVEEQIRKAEPTTDPLTKQKTIYKYIKMASPLRLIPGDSYVGNMFRLLRQSSNHSRKKGSAQADHHDERSMGAHSSASKWVSLQKWIDAHTRDILDESDEILHARFQLVYTTGPQQHMDGYPDRWTITQQVLRLVKGRARAISRNHPNFVEYACGSPGSFPHIHVVRASDAGRLLISFIVEDVMAGWLPNFGFQHITSPLRDAIRSFISDEDIFQVPDTAKRVEEYAKRSHQGRLWNGLLLLRGLLASNILLFTLSERRWRVDYGLASVSLPRHREHSDGSPIPTKLAVPYRAKDVPAPNTQFGHPDITIILTCLSYYYAGLSEEQLRVSFEMLLDQDDPSTEYAIWIKEHDRESVPDWLRTLSEINLRSSEQWDKVIFSLFARNQATIDFYLSRVVFPQEAKGFPWKLSGSSWDLGEKREKLVTGFSGTNDARWLLPTSVTQRDLDHQQGTNAKVLAYLLQPENDFYIVTHERGERQTTLEFLRLVTTQQPEIRVLLDVGAQILDFSNRQVAKEWLDIIRIAAGAVYFNENDELTILTRNGITQSLSSSPLSQQLDHCVVYLDHVHTRGTDTKLPIGSRAAVTLGPKVTKDALVQGCMRMRKLGHGHSVMFFAPPEVDRNIRAVAAKTDPKTQVTTVDILCWTIHETWTDIKQRAPYWAQQGMSHKSRSDAWFRFCNNDITEKQLSDAWLQPDLKPLADLYAPCETKNMSSTLSVLDPVIRQRCKDLGVLSLPSAQMEEEQEREVNREREREREVELPPKAEPAEHFLHQDIVAFVKTGIITPLHSGSAFIPVFTTLEKSSAATRDADVWSPFILATADFCKTIKPESTRGTIDQYLRPVQWILSSRRHGDQAQALVLLSPFEVDRLIPDIRASEYVHLHMYAPRTSQRMKPSDDLKLYSIPPLPSDWTPPWALIDQLNVFAGQLYLRDYESYRRLCRFLGVATKELPKDRAVRWNLFNVPGSFEENEITFSASPLPTVMALLVMRNRGRLFMHTHMGKILQGQLLTEKDF